MEIGFEGTDGFEDDGEGLCVVECDEGDAEGECVPDAGEGLLPFCVGGLDALVGVFEGEEDAEAVRGEVEWDDGDVGGEVGEGLGGG